MPTRFGRVGSLHFLRVAMLATLACGALAGPYWAAGRPRPMDLAVDRPWVRWPRTSWIPWERVETPEARLHRRLAALAARLERRPRLDAALVQFDVEGLAGAIERVLSRVEGRAQVSVHVRDLESGHVLFDHYGDSALTPASTQKILTGAAALDLLGPDYRFATRVLARPGALVLVGDGDPLLTADDIRRLGETVAGAVSVASIERVVVDDSAFSDRDDSAESFGEPGPGFAYRAPTSALAVDFNSVVVGVEPRSGRARPRVWTSPACERIRVDNRARMGRRDTLQVRSVDDGDGTRIEVRGTVARSGGSRRVRRRLHRPALVVGCLFARALVETEGLRPPRVERGRAEPGDVLVAMHVSPPLAEIVERGLAYSNNFIAEQVLRTVTREWTGRDDVEEGAEILESYARTVVGVEDGIAVENGSGLSRRARMSARSLVDLLAVAYRGQAEGTSVIDLLPVAGEPGTLRTRLRLSGKRVRAKTGTLAGVSGLSGVVTREDGTPQIGFAILINAMPEARLSARARRRIEDAVVIEVLRALDDYEAKRAGLVDPVAPGRG